MAEMTITDLISRLDMLQHNIWNTEEWAIRLVAMTAKLQSDMEALKSTIEIISEKLDLIENEIRAMQRTG